MKRRKLMFLCTGNSCRSQMAEGWARVLGGDLWEVHSAGLEAHGLNPRAVAVMAEAGVDISGHTSKTLDPDLLNRMDLVITVCGHADAHCPVTPPHVERLRWHFDDPAQARGGEEEILAEFRRVRDEIRARVAAFAEECRTETCRAEACGDPAGRDGRERP